MSAEERYQHAISMLENNSIDLAIKKLELLSEGGDGHADSVLGVIYEFGQNGVRPDPSRAIHWYQKSVRRTDSLQAHMGIGRLSLEGPDEVKDLKRAFQSFSFVATHSNYPQAWLSLGEMYMNGLGVSEDLEEASSCFRRAINLGNILGYKGLAEVSGKQGRRLKAVKYRAIAFCKALAALNQDQKSGEERLQRW